MSDELDRIMEGRDYRAMCQEQSEDSVNHPAHYTFGKVEVIDVLMEWFPQDPLLWQVGKYIARCNHKGNKKQDLLKAKFYLEKVIALL